MENQQGQKRPASESPASTPPPSVRERDGYLNNEPSSSWSSFEAEQSEFRSPSRSLTSSPSPFSPLPDNLPNTPFLPFSQADEDSSLNGSIEAALNTFTESVNFAASTFAFTVKQLFINGGSNLAASSNSHHLVNSNMMGSPLSGSGSSGGSGGKPRQVHPSKSYSASNGTTSSAAVTTNGHHGSAAASVEEEWPSLKGDSGVGGGLLNGNSSATFGNKSTAAAAASAADKLRGGFQDRVNFCEKVIKSKKSKGGGGGSRGGNSTSSNSSASAGNANTASGGGSG
ncbi:hypothetical protein TYRP_019442 [Tyrophagus putrescentiae]|nr:hypothetical protein TYRP_019442 [Tyrophagus putrescentiae]